MTYYDKWLLELVSLWHGSKAASHWSRAILEPCQANQGSLTTGKLGIC